MPARLLMTGTLLIWSGLALSQQFLVAGCDSTCQTAFSTIPEDIMVDCLADLPAFDLPATEGCDGAPVANVPHVELNEDVITTYDLGTAYGPGDDWALWLGNFEAMGLGASDHFVPDASGVQLDLYANGTARITGRVVNDTDANQQFDLDLFLQYGQDYDAWTAQGRFPKDDLGLMAYVDWTFFEMVDTLSRIEGAGAFAGDVLYLDHMPVSRAFGFQLGADGANNRNTNFGISGWFWYRGVMNGAPITGTGDVNADLTNESVQGLACPVVESVERHAMAWSACGHHATSYSIERHDLEAPVFVELPPLESADCTSLPDTADIAEFVVTDDCGSALSLEVLSDVVDGEPCNQQLTRTWRLTDACGNATDTFQVVTLVDTTGPEFAVQDETILCEDYADYVPSTPSFTDNCTPTESIVWSVEEGDPVGAFPSDFTWTVTYTATDLCGNATVQSATLTVLDTVAPVLTDLPADTLLDCAAWPDYVAPVPGAEDNCTSDLGSPAVDTVLTPGACEGQFTVAITTTYADLAGNAASHTQTIDVTDTTAPEFTYFPGTVTLDCEEAWPAVEGNNLPVGSDDCSGVDLTWTESESEGGCPGSSVLTRVFTLTDGCGNSTSASQILQREDNAGPAWTFVPGDVDIACGTDLPSNMAMAQDNCAGVDSVWVTLEEIDPSEGGNIDPCPVIARYIRTFQAVDLCGNASSAFQTVDVIDTVAPVLQNLPADTLIACGAMLPAHGVTAFDACTNAQVTTAVDTLAIDCPGTYTLLRTFTVTDACNNSAQAQQTIEVVDTVAPTSDVLAEVTILCDEALPTNLPNATDACSNPVTVELFSVDSVAGDCPQAWEVTRTFVATDACGNAGFSSQLVHVVDTVAPVLVLGLDSVTLECGSPLPLNLPSYADACDIMVNVMELMPDTVTGDCPGEYVVTRHFEALDACVNVSHSSQTVIFTDTGAPEFDNVPGPVTIECDMDLPTELPTALDDCSGPVGVVLFAVDSVAGDCPQAWTVTRTFRATDVCGNQADATQLVTIVDTTAPVIDTTTVPEPAFFSCSVEHPTCADFDVLAFDNCGGTEVNCMVDTLFTDCPATFTLEMTFTASDECANDAMLTVQFDVADTTAPILNLDLAPVNDTIQCTPDYPDLFDATAFSVEDECSEWTLGASREVVGDDENPCDYVLIDTYTFTDCNGNETVFVHTRTVIDSEGPNLPTSVVADEEYYCAFEVPEFAMPITASMLADDDYPFGAVSDNCAAQDEIVIDYSDSILVNNGPNNYTVQRTWTLTDHCDNKTEVVQVIIVAEPELILPNAFSPGNNTFNDRFVIEGLGIVDDGADEVYPPCDWGPDDQQHFMVFNRWGSEVYSLPPGEPYRNDWNGRNNNDEPLVDGTYFVLLRLGERKLGQYVDLRNDK